jgi:Domain of unknown function (DUF5658)
VSTSNKDAKAQPSETVNRRDREERRKTGFKSMVYAFFYSRRREPRRDGEDVVYYTDWYGVPLFVLAVGIALLCVADAFFTLELITRGGSELNPFMAYLLNKGLHIFVGVKMALTIGAVMLLILHQRFAFFLKVRAAHVLLVTFFGYAILIAYELILLGPYQLFEY